MACDALQLLLRRAKSPRAMRTLPPLAGLLLLAACASSSSPVVGGTDYVPQYDFSEFYAATNDKTFRVVVAGNPFPQIAPQEMQ